MEGRTIVITGASSGIGAALARRAAAAGAQVMLAARRVPELNAVTAACGSGAFALATDVTRRGEVERLLDAAVARFGQVDAWVNNAGRGITKPVAQLTDDEFDEMMRVNVKSALYGMQAVLPHFQARGRGHIVNVSSALGRVPFASSRSGYNAAKHALNALTASLRIELRERWPEIHRVAGRRRDRVRRPRARRRAGFAHAAERAAGRRGGGRHPRGAAPPTCGRLHAPGPAGARGRLLLGGGHGGVRSRLRARTGRAVQAELSAATAGVRDPDNRPPDLAARVVESSGARRRHATAHPPVRFPAP
jgi:NADP-dependent 3-hydroxy acid dehydrogenase YdfG